MSMHEYALLSAPATHDHYSSAFLQGYHHPNFESDRFLAHSSVSQTPIERFLHPMSGGEISQSAREHFLAAQDRRLSEPGPRTAYMPRQSLPQPAYPQGFEYNHNPMSNSAFLPIQRGASSSSMEQVHVRSLVGFDPRPPHAGWTPKEEVDEEEQTRELLGSSLGSGGRSPAESHGLQSPTDIREDSNSPSNAAVSPSSASKTYSFVSLPGNAVRKRPRRRYDEIERLYACSWPDCTKAYGTLNHLNAHVSMQRHGPKRSPAEFKELRKQWRQQKKQDTTQAGSADAASRSTPRRRRGTEPSLSLTMPGEPGFDPTVSSHPSHRLSLGDIRYPPPSDDENAIGPSPTSTASDSVNYWQDSPVSPAVEVQHPSHPQSARPGLHYHMPLAEPSSRLSPGNLSPPLSRLPPDSTLLTPLPGYRPPSPPISRLEPGSTLLQPLHPSTLASLTPGSPNRRRRSPDDPRNFEQ